MEAPVGFVHNNSFYEDELYNEGSKAEESQTQVLIIFSVVILLSLIGNILVVVISVFYMRLRSLTIIFILNLALSDLLSTVVPLFWVCDYIWGLTLGDAVCKVVDFIDSTGFYSSIMFLVLMSIQRYMARVHPLSGWKKGRCFTLVLVCAWLVSMLAAVPVTVHAEAYPDSRHCMYSSITALVALMYERHIVFVCAFLVMAFCYIRILQTIFKSPTNQKHRTTALAFFLVATFFICWAPYNIVNFIWLLDYQIGFYNQVLEHLYYAKYICGLLAATQCCLNPVIYGLFGVKFRKTVREIFQRRAFNFAQMRMVELHSGSFVNLNNQVPELDIKT
ncbi:chemokine XC receptor 1-like [Pangasianodon hypophthalmus]|uniref:chemokine XC receptor 1-like n=1 Tax=Pangasianodon hypophthalmus TaxID=310915 RepID=UPI002307F023|nr:chemokine XC receptor 1-like [Pangasianodon hypophthalmus]